MCRPTSLLTLLIACTSLIGALEEVAFRELFNTTSENNATTTWTNNNGTLGSNNTTSNTNSTFNWENRIIGGQVVSNRAQFAYQASLRLSTNHGAFHICGATIIDEQHLLTAAHCVVSESGVVTRPSTLFSVVGDLNVFQLHGLSVIRNISHIFTHPNYNIRRTQHDVAVLRVSRPYNWTLFVSPIPLASITPPDNTNCTVSGWGVTETGFPSDVLRFVHVPIVPFSTCRNTYGIHFIPGMMCAGFMQGGSNACQGDSGGPLVCLNSVAGIVSRGNQCALPRLPGIYTNVAMYRNWIIQQTMRSSSETATMSVLGVLLVVMVSIYNSG